MKRILIILLHDNIDFISDRSLRDLLKNLGKITRRVQIEEIRYLLESSNLSKRECQSLLDLVKNESQHAPVYFLSKIRKGSLEASFLMAASFLGALAAKLVETVVIDLSTKNKFYKRMLEYMGGERSSRLVSKLEEELGTANLGRFFVDNIKVTETKKRVIVHVELETPPELADSMEQEFDELRVQLILEQRMRETTVS